MWDGSLSVLRLSFVSWVATLIITLSIPSGYIHTIYFCLAMHFIQGFSSVLSDKTIPVLAQIARAVWSPERAAVPTASIANSSSEPPRFAPISTRSSTTLPWP